ncbi:MULTISPECIES: sodium:solute symporter family protein [unclassified Colwellia]|uniref:sodium:solute symporter family protein n=1 Tax=unclassified Colwellia TaxID=196834 RepID=UPI0015F40E0E|nr:MULTISPECIES: sodium:solute symporter family protein [unclassified Colwellia]MBA6231158.1 cation acetate symporter [Colwellia sp. MB02u-7]MBA6235073.1 cation acetate symporter [Colwellia sp. MB02u-11]MBA6257543.1 cation acetate symporter [Colwellia sp. MB3u-28]MBA6260615.1 cation acetate symporter [Colwellia sp. MB3u-41]MBA6301718.1 cation acetate symporter [Colwellia sp. MB3u-22]
MDELKLYTYIAVFGSFAVYFAIAWWARAGSTSDFYVAGGGVTPLQNGMAIGADWMSAASFISMAGMISFLGYGGSVFLMGWTGGYVLLAMLLAPYMRKHGKFTVPEFIFDRYYSKTARVVAVVCLIIASLTYIIGQMKGVGVAFSRFLEVEYDNGLYIGMFVVWVYAVLGGMKGITYTQIAQYIVLIFAYTIPAVFISLQLTGNPIPQLGLGSTLADGSGVYLLDKLDLVVTELGFKEYTTDNMGGTVNMFAYTLSLMIGTAGLPHVIMRFFTVPSVKAARQSAGYALVFIALLYTVAPAVGAMARLNLMNTIEPVAGQNLDYAERPQWFKDWEKTGLLKYEEKNGDGKIQYTADKATNEMVKVDRDIMVLANPAIANLPNWVIALVAAGGLAAALSTAAGLLLAISSSISHDLMKGILTPDLSEKNELLAGRVVMTISVLVAGWLGLNPPGFAAGTVALAFGLAASSIFPALMMGIFAKKMSGKAAVAGMISGIGVTMLYVFQHKGIMFIPGTSFLGDMGPNWFFGISPNAFGSVGAAVNFAVAFAMLKVTGPAPAHIQQMVENFRTPHGGVSEAHDH